MQGPGSLGVVSYIAIIAGSAGEGLFVYSGAPAFGDLIVSIAGVSGTDLYGNAYQSGIVTYGGGAGFYTRMASNGIAFSIGAGINGSVVATSTASGNLTLTDPALPGNNAASIELSDSGNASGQPAVLVNGGAFLKQIAAPGAIAGYNLIYADVFGAIHLVGITAIDGSGFLQMSDISAPSSNSGTARMFASAPGHLNYVDGAASSGVTWDTGRLTILIPQNAAISNSGVTLATFTVAAASYKLVALILNANNAAGAADNASLKFTLATAVVSSFGIVQQVTDSTGIFATTIPLTFTAAFNTSNVNVGHQMAVIKGQVTFSTAGTFSLVATANTANNTTVFPSYIELVPVIA